MQALRAFVFALALPALALPPAQAADGQALADTLISRSDAVVAKLTALRSGGGLNNQAALRIIQEEFSPLLDFEQLTKRAMGKHWRKTDDALRAQVTDAFRQLLEKTYAKVVAQFSGQEVKLLSVKPLPKDKTAVLLEIGGGGGKSAKVEYVFSAAEGGGEPLIGDIKVEGISLVANYRRQFASVIKKDGVEALVGKLQQLAAAKF